LLPIGNAASQYPSGWSVERRKQVLLKKAFFSAKKKAFFIL